MKKNSYPCLVLGHTFIKISRLFGMEELVALVVDHITDVK